MKYSLVFVFRGSKVLLINRFNNPAKGLWTGLGGHFERNKDYDMFDCAHRELYEEAGISGIRLNYIYSEKEIDSDIFYGIQGTKCTSDALTTKEGIIYWYNIKDALDVNNKGLNNITKNIIKEILREVKDVNNLL